MKTAVVIGSTGLIGRLLVEKLAQQGAWSNVLAITRKPQVWKNAKIRTLVFDFDNWGDLELQVRSFSGSTSIDCFCCLGTTISAAGSEESFRKIDYEAVVMFSQLAKNCRAEQLLVVSSLGADYNSNVFYNKTKGEMERAVAETFKAKLYFARPSLLLGDRKDFRFLERIAILTSALYKPFLRGRFAKYKPIPSDKVARALVLVAAKHKVASQIIENLELHQLGNSLF